MGESTKERRGMKRRRTVALFASFAVVATAFVTGGFSAAASASSSKTVTVMYWTNFDNPGTNATPDLIKAAAADLKKQEPGVNVVLDPITTDSESTYYAKIDLAQRSASTAPDVVMEDSFLIGSDASAGFIQPIPQIKKWSGWSQFPSAMKSIVTYAGKTYGVMNSTDVQLAYYDTKLFKKAGLPVPWQPHSFADIVAASKALAKFGSQHHADVLVHRDAVGRSVVISGLRGLPRRYEGSAVRQFDREVGDRWSGLHGDLELPRRDAKVRRARVAVVESECRRDREPQYDARRQGRHRL